MPNEISSESESSSTPIGPAVCNALATRPSNASAIIAKMIQVAAVLNSPINESMIANPPKSALAAVTPLAIHDLFIISASLSPSNHLERNLLFLHKFQLLRECRVLYMTQI